MASNEYIQKLFFHSDLAHKCPSRATVVWRVCSAFTGTSQPASHTLLCLSIFHPLMLAVWQSHTACTGVPGSQVSSCLSSHKHCTLTRPFPYSLQQGINLRCTGQKSDTETGLVKTKQKPSLSSAYLIWFIKQARESEVLVGSTHIHHCFLQKEQSTVVQTCWQAPCHRPPSNAASSEAWATQETALIQQAPSSQLSSELAVHQFQRDFPWLSQQPPSTPHLASCSSHRITWFMAHYKLF